VIGAFPAPPGASLSIGPLELRAYGLMIAAGVVAAVWLMGRRLEQRGVGTRDDAAGIAIWAVGAGVIGSRLYHVITEWDRFRDDLGSIPAIWKGGLGIPGGLIAGIIVGTWAARRYGISPAAAATCAAPAIPLAQAIGRWGNWFNQELFGRPTDVWWALRVDDSALPPGFAPGTTFHPTFLYESLWCLGLVAFLLWIDRAHDPGPGRLMGVYLVGYGIGRFWIEGLRIDPSGEAGGLRTNQWVALATIIGASIYLVATRGATWPAPQSPESVASESVASDADTAGLQPGDDEPGDAQLGDDQSGSRSPD